MQLAAKFRAATSLAKDIAWWVMIISATGLATWLLKVEISNGLLLLTTLALPSASESVPAGV